MFKLALRPFAAPKPPPAPERHASTDGRLIYAVGDVHGRADLLLRMIKQIADDVAQQAIDISPLVVFLGDYVDRGPDSKGVVESILALAEVEELEVRALRGNHEEALSLFLTQPSFGPTWMVHGGAATLMSYGVQVPPPDAEPERWEETCAAFTEALPEDHKRFYDTLEPMVQVGGYLFVHAGVRPGVPLDEQTEHDMMWIREPFLSAADPSDKVVVHGHTPAREPHKGSTRIGLDTGAYATGVLTGVRLLDEEAQILQARLQHDRSA